MNGTVTVGAGTPGQREIGILDFVQCFFKENRVITVGTLEDGSMILGVENLKSSGRAAQATMWLSPESVIGLVATISIYWNQKGLNVEQMLQSSLDRDDLIDFRFSENIKSKGDEASL